MEKHIHAKGKKNTQHEKKLEKPTESFKELSLLDHSQHVEEERKMRKRYVTDKIIFRQNNFKVSKTRM